MQTIILSSSTSDRAILTYFATPVGPRQGKAPRNTSGSRKTSSRVLTQNAHSSTAHEQESPVFSMSIEEALFGQRSRKARQKKKASISSLFSADTPTKEPQKPNNGLWQFRLERPEDSQPLVSRSNIKQIAKEKTAYSRPFIELYTVFQVLQEVDPFLQQRRLYFAETRSVKQSVDGAPTGVLATIVEKTTDLTPDFPQGVEATEQLQDHSEDVEDPEGSALG